MSYCACPVWRCATDGANVIHRVTCYEVYVIKLGVGVWTAQALNTVQLLLYFSIRPYACAVDVLTYVNVIERCACDRYIAHVTYNLINVICN